MQWGGFRRTLHHSAFQLWGRFSVPQTAQGIGYTYSSFTNYFHSWQPKLKLLSFFFCQNAYIEFSKIGGCI